MNEHRQNMTTDLIAKNVPLTLVESQLLDLSASERVVRITENINQIAQSAESTAERFNQLLSFNQIVAECINQKLNQYDTTHHSSQVGQVKHSLMLGMIRAFADAYIKITKEMIVNDNVTSMLLVDCIYFGAYFTSKAIIYSYYFLQVIPADTWRNLHSLYIMADEKKLAKITPTATIEISCNLNTTELIYKNILIFSTLDPYGFRINMLHKVFCMTKLYSSLLHLNENKTHPGIIYKIDRAQVHDRPPVKISDETVGSNSNYYLDFSLINQRLESLILSIKQSNRVNSRYTEVELSLPLYLIEKISKTWKTSHSRKSERIKCHQETIVCFGLSNIFKALQMSANKINECIVEAAEYDKDIFLKSHQNPFAFNGEIENSSENGYLVKLGNTEMVSNYVGELIALMKTDDSLKVTWEIGVVRWAYHVAQNNNSLGVEILMREPNPVMVKYESVNSQVEYPALISDSCMFVFNEIFIPGQVVKVCDIVDEYKVQLTNNIVLSALYTQFPFSLYK